MTMIEGWDFTVLGGHTYEHAGVINTNGPINEPELRIVTDPTLAPMVVLSLVLGAQRVVRDVHIGALCERIPLRCGVVFAGTPYRLVMRNDSAQAVRVYGAIVNVAEVVSAEPYARQRDRAKRRIDEIKSGARAAAVGDVIAGMRPLELVRRLVDAHDAPPEDEEGDSWESPTWEEP